VDQVPKLKYKMAYQNARDVAVSGYFPSWKSIIKYPCRVSSKLNFVKKIPRVLKELC